MYICNLQPTFLFSIPWLTPDNVVYWKSKRILFTYKYGSSLPYFTFFSKNFSTLPQRGFESYPSKSPHLQKVFGNMFVNLCSLLKDLCLANQRQLHPWEVQLWHENHENNQTSHVVRKSRIEEIFTTLARQTTANCNRMMIACRRCIELISTVDMALIMNPWKTWQLATRSVDTAVIRRNTCTHYLSGAI